MPAAKKNPASKKSTGKKVSASKSALSRVKMEAAKEVGVNLNSKKKISKKEAGKVGGQMVKKMVESYGK